MGPPPGPGWFTVKCPDRFFADVKIQGSSGAWYLFENVALVAVTAAIPNAGTPRFYDITPDGLTSSDGSRTLHQGTASYVCWNKLGWIGGVPNVQTYEQLWSCDGILEPDDNADDGAGATCDDGNYVDEYVDDPSSASDTSCSDGSDTEDVSSGSSAGGSTLTCTSEYIYIEENDGYGWYTIWEGYADVCE